MRKLFFLLLILFNSIAYSQVSFQFLPELHGRNTDGLFRIDIVNSTGTTITNTRLVMKIAVKGAGEVLNLRITNLLIQPGLNRLQSAHTSNAQVQFSDHEFSRIIKQSGVFPEGEYTYCFILEEGNKPSGPGAELGKDCFSYTLEALSPLSLMEPYNKENICNKNPTLVWQPIFPAIPGLQYQLTLAEIKEKQTPTEALFYNVPLVNSKNLITSYLPYPAYAKPLDTGKVYVWQVTAYKSDLILSRSEIWTFKIGCTDEKVNTSIDGYRNIEDLAMGNFYLAKGQVLFALNNPYGETVLSYSIQCLNKPDLKIKGLPIVQLKRGSNQISIVLDEGRSFKNGYSYLMKVQLPNGTEKQLRFIYKAP